MNEKFDGVLNNGKDFNMSKICSCNKNMTECEKNCGKYYSCDSIATVNDILKGYEECLCELIEKIDKTINNKAEKFGVMGTEQISVSIELTDEEKELFFEIDKYDTENYFYSFNGNVLDISYTEENNRRLEF